MVWINLDNTYKYRHIEYGDRLYDALSWGTSDGYRPYQTINSEGLIKFSTSLTEIGPDHCSDAYWNLSHTTKTIDGLDSAISGYSGSHDGGDSFIACGQDGAASVFEIGDSGYWQYDPDNAARRASDPQFDDPYLFVARQNESFQNDFHQEPYSTWSTWGENNQHRYTNNLALHAAAIADDGKMDIYELIDISRAGEPGLSDFRDNVNSHFGWFGTHYTNAANIGLGVNSPANKKYACVLTALGQCDYSIFIPVWVGNGQDGTLSAYVDGDTTSIGYYATRLIEDIYLPVTPGDNDDLYINDLYADVQANIVEGVIAARDRWFSSGDQSDFPNTIKYLHRWSANAAYFTIKAAYESAGSGRDCNPPPRFDAFSVVSPGSGEIRVTFDPDEALAQYTVHWGNGTTSGWQDAGGSSDPQTITETGFVDGSTFLVAVLIEDNHASSARNVKFGWVTVADAQPQCGDGVCSESEGCLSCAEDCGACCGDGTCVLDHDEDCETCPSDCPTGTGEVCCAGVLYSGDCCDAQDCDDAVACTTDTCTSHVCENSADHAACDNHLFCDGVEKCDLVSGCEDGAGDPCVAPTVCDEAADACIGCLSADDCDDGIDCTHETCDAGACVHEPDDAICDNGVYCDGGETCAFGLGCQAKVPPCSEEQTCDEENDACVVIERCGDGLLDAGEDCDDGNRNAGDGCSDVCALESGWVCDASEPSRCGVDTDGDGISDRQDNCADVANPAQEDEDEDGIGDACLGDRTLVGVGCASVGLRPSRAWLLVALVLALWRKRRPRQT